MTAVGFVVWISYMQCSYQTQWLMGLGNCITYKRNMKSWTNLEHDTIKVLNLAQKQPPKVCFEKRCSEKFHITRRKTPVPESFFNKVAKKRLWHRCFPVNFAKFLRTPFLQNTSRPLLLLAQSWKISTIMVMI